MAIWLMVSQISKYVTFAIFHKATGSLKIVSALVLNHRRPRLHL